MDITTKFSIGDEVWTIFLASSGDPCPTCGVFARAKTWQVTAYPRKVEEIRLEVSCVLNPDSVDVDVSYYFSSENVAYAERHLFTTRDEALATAEVLNEELAQRNVKAERMRKEL